MFAGIIVSVILIFTVIMILGLVFKKNRNDKEYVGAIKTVVGNMIWIYVGIPICFLFIMCIGIYNFVNGYKATSRSSDISSTSNTAIEKDKDDRLVSGDDQRQIHDAITSGMTPQEASSMSHKNQDVDKLRGAGDEGDGLGEPFTDDEAKFSINFPSGWKVGRPENSKYRDIAAIQTASDGFIRISIQPGNPDFYNDKNAVSKLTKFALESVQRNSPDAEVYQADRINGITSSGFKYTGIFVNIKPTKDDYFLVLDLPVNNRVYHITSHGNIQTFDSVRKSLATLVIN